MLDKNRPTAAWISEIRARFPCEREIDRVLTRKLSRRPGTEYSPISLETMTEATSAFLKSAIDGPFEIARPRWLTGGASKLQMAFDLSWTPEGGSATTKGMVLRMEPSESIVETSRLREFQVIKAVENDVPVPPAYWVDSEGEYLPYPGLIYGLVSGVAKPTGRTTRVSSLGVDLGPELRPIIAEQFLDHLKTIHLLDWTKRALPDFDIPSTPTEAALWQVNWWERAWTEDANEEIPLLDVAACWMRENLPAITQPRLIHGDYRNGNFLFDEGTGKITALLDWELAHLGDYHEDVAWVVTSCFGHMAEDGKTFLISGLMSRENFLDRYQEATDLPINPKALAFYEIFVLYKCAVLVLGTGYRVARGGKTHQDILVTWLMGVGYRLLNEMRVLLEEVA